MRARIKSVIVSMILILFVFSSFIGRLLLPNLRRKKMFAALCQSVASKWVLRALGVTIDVEVKNAVLEGSGPVLIVSNHQTYLDVLVISTVFPSVFISTREIEKKKFLGAIARAGGSVFIERRSRNSLFDDMAMISEVLTSGVPVVMFPEGTTSDGTDLLPFKAPLLKAAVDATADVVVACIRYEKIDGRDVRAEDRQRVVYHGTMSFSKHLSGIMDMKSLSVRLSFLERIRFESGRSRKEISESAFQSIRNEFLKK